MLGVDHVTHVTTRKVQEECAVFKVKDAIIEVSRFTGHAVANSDSVVTESLPIDLPGPIGHQRYFQVFWWSREHAGARADTVETQEHNEYKDFAAAHRSQ